MYTQDIAYMYNIMFVWIVSHSEAEFANHEYSVVTVTVSVAGSPWS